MSFLKRLILAVILLMILGVPLSAMYYEPAQSLPSRTDEDRLAQQDNALPAGKEAPGVPVLQERQEEDAPTAPVHRQRPSSATNALRIEDRPGFQAARTGRHKGGAHADVPLLQDDVPRHGRQVPLLRRAEAVGGNVHDTGHPEACADQATRDAHQPQRL